MSGWLPSELKALDTSTLKLFFSSLLSNVNENSREYKVIDVWIYEAGVQCTFSPHMQNILLMNRKFWCKRFIQKVNWIRIMLTKPNEWCKIQCVNTWRKRFPDCLGVFSRFQTWNFTSAECNLFVRKIYYSWSMSLHLTWALLFPALLFIS